MDEQHRNYLEHMDEIIETKHRPQYIVYFDGRPVGKFSFNIDGDVVKDEGLFLFHVEDQGKRIGFFMRLFFFKYVFETLKIILVRNETRDDNFRQIRLNEFFGEKIIGKQFG